MAEPIFKHLSEEETLVAREFINRVIPDAKLKFDVPLKSKLPLGISEMKEPYKSLWEYLTAKKIDIVAEYPDKVMIIEVKQRLHASAVGQLLLYKKMYLEQYKPAKPIELWHIAMYPDLDVIDLLKDLGIKWWCLNESII